MFESSRKLLLMRSMTGKFLFDKGAQVPKNLGRLYYPGLRQALVAAEADAETMARLAALNAEYLRLRDAEKGAEAPAPQTTARRRRTARSTPRTAKREQLTLQRILLLLAAALGLLLIAGNWTNFFGKVVPQAIVLWLTWSAWQRINPRPEVATEGSVKERLIAFWNRLDDLTPAEAYKRFLAWGKSTHLPVTIFLAAGTVISIQLIHLADGNAGDLFRFATAPNLVLVAAGIAVAFLGHWLVTQMVKGVLSPKAIWALAVVTVICFLLLFGTGERIYYTLFPIQTPLHTVTDGVL